MRQRQCRQKEGRLGAPGRGRGGRAGCAQGVQTNLLRGDHIHDHTTLRERSRRAGGSAVGGPAGGARQPRSSGLPSIPSSAAATLPRCALPLRAACCYIAAQRFRPGHQLSASRQRSAVAPAARRSWSNRSGAAGQPGCPAGPGLLQAATTSLPSPGSVQAGRRGASACKPQPCSSLLDRWPCHRGPRAWAARPVCSEPETPGRAGAASPSSHLEHLGQAHLQPGAQGRCISAPTLPGAAPECKQRPGPRREPAP